MYYTRENGGENITPEFRLAANTMIAAIEDEKERTMYASAMDNMLDDYDGDDYLTTLRNGVSIAWRLMNNRHPDEAWEVLNLLASDFAEFLWWNPLEVE